jgi:large subunit ribosomal protein L30
MAKKLKIKQVRSTIGRLENQKRTMKALGIHKIGQTVVHDNNQAIRGMIEKVQHLVVVDESDGE